VGSGFTSGIITNNSETLGLDNLEFEAIRGICGAPDRGSISYNGPNG